MDHICTALSEFPCPPSSSNIAHKSSYVFPKTMNHNCLLLYDTDTASRILSMASIPNKEHSLLFLQCVYLMGPGNYSVQATDQVGDRAMRNCISKECWDQYSHCLPALHPSSTHIKVTNSTKLKLLGKWFGTIHVSGVSAASWFEVFDSHRAFDVILGKPWLTQVKATHNYGTDQLFITTNSTTDTLSNTWFELRSQNQYQQTCQSCQSLWTLKHHQRTS